MWKNELNNCAGIYVFEGIDNVGKSTIVQKLKSKICETTNFDCVSIAFPGNESGTLGNLVYEIHHNSDKFFDGFINEASLQLLHVAAHIDLIQRKLIEYNNSSKIILMDRFWWSTYAYGLTGKLDKGIIKAIIEPELIYWKQLNIKRVYLLERENREIEYSLAKDLAIIQNYRFLVQNEPKSMIINNDNSLDETIFKIFNNMLGDNGICDSKN